MDRAREPGAARSARRRAERRKHRDRGRQLLTLPRALFLFALATLFACKLNTDPDQAVAIEVILPDSGRVEVSDTFHPRARALNGVGDSVAADVFWAALDTAILSVLDSTTGASLGRAVGSGRLQARVGALRSEPQRVAVIPRPDSIKAGGSARDTVALPDSLSDSLLVQAFATGSQPANRRVAYSATTFPGGGTTVTFVPQDTALTNSVGVATVQLRFSSGAVPDSVVVTATMRRLNGTVVSGSPVTFVVEFRP